MSETDLTTAQQRALNLIMSGLPDAQVARQLRLSRQTVNRWRNEHLAFRQALEMRRVLLRQAHMDALSALVEKSLSVLNDALQNGDPDTRLKVATFILRVSGLQGFAAPPSPKSRAEQEKETFISIFESALKDLHLDGRIPPNFPNAS